MTKNKNKVLVKERLKRNLKQHEFAEMLGISQALLSQLETCTREPSFEMAKRLSKLLDIPIGELFPRFKL